MKGVSGADYMCYRQAKEAGLPGTYRAFLGSKLQDLKSIVHRPEDMQIPIVNSKVKSNCRCFCP
jgi:collagen type XVIII alpha